MKLPIWQDKKRVTFYYRWLLNRDDRFGTFDCECNNFLTLICIKSGVFAIFVSMCLQRFFKTDKQANINRYYMSRDVCKSCSDINGYTYM